MWLFFLGPATPPRLVEAGRNLSQPGREPGSLSRHSPLLYGARGDWCPAEPHRPAVVDRPRTAFAAVRITSMTRSGWERIGTWLLSGSYVVASIRCANKRSRSA